MTRTKKTRRGLVAAAESLEDRCIPAAFGIPWGDAQHLTLSFVPDGTPIAGHVSNLFQTLNARTPSSDWQRTILRAFQTWGVNANVNIGLTGDNGAPLGTAGLTQGDARFGDIRVAAQAMAPESLSISVPNDFSFSGTLSGDVVLNSSAFAGSSPDLFAVALHEAGHVFGIDHSVDPNSPMYPNYNNIKKLTGGDVAALQGLYGARAPDAYEGSSGNDSMSKAATIPFPGGYKGATPLVVFGDVSSNKDVDFYAVRPPSGYRGSVTFRLQSAGISLLTTKLTLLDSKGKVLARSEAASDFGDTVSLTLAQADPNATYYVKVEGDTGDVFGIGGYGLSVNFDAASTVSSAGLDAFLRSGPGLLSQDEVAAAFQNPGHALIHDDLHSNDDLIAATRLATTPGFAPNTHFATLGSIASPTDVDYYRVDGPGGLQDVLTVVLRGVGANGTVPRATLLDSDGLPVASRVLANGNGVFTLQAAGVKSSGHYLVKVEGNGGPSSMGNYALEVITGQVAADLTSFAGGSVAASNVASYNLYVAQSQLFQFLLTTGPATAPAGSAVRMTILNGAGRVVFSLVGGVGQTVSGPALFLTPGAYIVRFESVAGAGEVAPSLTYQLDGESISDPVGPALSDPTLSPLYIAQRPRPGSPPLYTYPNNITSPRPYMLVQAP